MLCHGHGGLPEDWRRAQLLVAALALRGDAPPLWSATLGAVRRCPPWPVDNVHSGRLSALGLKGTKMLGSRGMRNVNPPSSVCALAVWAGARGHASLPRLRQHPSVCKSALITTLARARMSAADDGPPAAALPVRGGAAAGQAERWEGAQDWILEGRALRPAARTRDANENDSHD